MSTEHAIAALLILGLVLANVPFLSGPRPAIHVGGWLAAYGGWMAAARLFATADGQAAPGGWEIWAISAALFAVLAFPGIVWRHLMRA